MTSDIRSEGSVRQRRTDNRVVVFQNKYRGAAKKEMSGALYATLADTSDTSFAREMSGVLSEVPTGRREQTLAPCWSKMTLQTGNVSFPVTNRRSTEQTQ